MVTVQSQKLCSMAMFMLPVSALDVAGIERKLLQTMEMITAKKRKVGKLVVVNNFKSINRKCASAEVRNFISLYKMQLGFFQG